MTIGHRFQQTPKMLTKHCAQTSHVKCSNSACSPRRTGWGAKQTIGSKYWVLMRWHCARKGWLRARTRLKTPHYGFVILVLNDAIAITLPSRLSVLVQFHPPPSSPLDGVSSISHGLGRSPLSRSLCPTHSTSTASTLAVVNTAGYPETITCSQTISLTLTCHLLSQA